MPISSENEQQLPEREDSIHQVIKTFYELDDQKNKKNKNKKEMDLFDLTKVFNSSFTLASENFVDDLDDSELKNDLMSPTLELVDSKIKNSEIRAITTQVTDMFTYLRSDASIGRQFKLTGVLGKIKNNQPVCYSLPLSRKKTGVEIGLPKITVSQKIMRFFFSRET